MSDPHDMTASEPAREWVEMSTAWREHRMLAHQSFQRLVDMADAAIAAITQRNDELEAEVERLKRCGNCNAWVIDMVDHETHLCMARPVDGRWSVVHDSDLCHFEPSLWSHIIHQPDPPEGEG